MARHITLDALLLASAMLVASACGGGGGASSDPDPKDTPPDTDASGGAPDAAAGGTGGTPVEPDARVPDAAPRTDQGNALDDDCNGVTDENLGIRRCSRGVCDHEVPACMGGVGMDCDPREGASAEQCTGLDDDCDGVIDPPPCGDLAPLDPAIQGPILGRLLTP
jgi:hypothetical protein